jgi:hypothetical protein
MQKIVKAIKSPYNFLTEDKEYIVMEESSYYYKIINDRGKLTRYGQKYFIEKNEKEKQYSPEEIIAKAFIKKDGIDTTIPNIPRIYNHQFNTFEGNISCGVRDIDGINGTVSIIKSFLSNFGYLTQKDKDKLSVVFFKKWIEVLLRNYSETFLILSTNKSYDSNGIIWDILDNMSTISQEGYNNNSKRDIKLWVFARDKDGNLIVTN